MAAATPLIIPPKSQEAIIQFHRQCYGMANRQWNVREQMRRIDLDYMRENDFTQEQLKARIANAYGDSRKFQNVTVPVVLPQVESAVTYQSSVFLTGSPLFGWVAPPESEDEALQYQAIIEENATRGGWVQQLQLFLRDGFKYNLGAVEVTWDRSVTAAIETDLSFDTKEGKPKEVVWEGNCINRWDLYNTFWDTRYKPTEIYKNGEFVGNTKLMSRIHLKKFINELPDKMVANIVPAFESPYSGGPGSIGGIETYYVPLINPLALVNTDPRRSMDWLAWAGMFDRQGADIQYQNLYEVTTMYARIMPSDFNLRLPAPNTPQVWKFIIINHSVLIYAERQTNAHNYLPVLFCQPNEDGLGYQTKSLAQNAQPFQAIASALVNSAMAARRRAISDRAIYDPSRISTAHIDSDNPSAKIPLRPAGYGKPINEAYYSVPFKDDQSAVAFQEIPQVLAMADKVNGQNPAKQGQFVKGNKTLHEYADVMSHANGRDQMTAMLLEAQTFTPMKEILKINTIQYQAGVSLFSPAQKRVVQVDPVALRKSFATYQLSDGLTPTEKIINGDDFTTAVQMLATSPALGSGYNVAPAFSYLMKTRNVILQPFEKSPAQIAYEEGVQKWQEVVLEAAKKGVDPSKLPPQPLPQNYGYQPAGNNVSTPAQTQVTPQQPAGQ